MDNERIFDALVLSLTDVIEVRDGSTGGHSRRVAAYTECLLNKLYQKGLYPEIINPEYIYRIVRSAMLHDIGKVGVMDSLLTGPKFSPDDTEAIEDMHRHTLMGAHVLDSAIKKVGEGTFLSDARQVALSHHERWDGSGYPEGLKGEQIPLSARIVAIADVYDALTSKRSYKEPYSHDLACKIILSGSGRDFDPELIKVFDEMKRAFRKVATSVDNII